MHLVAGCLQILAASIFAVTGRLHIKGNRDNLAVLSACSAMMFANGGLWNLYA